MSRRPRGRGRKPQHNSNKNNPNRALDSNGPDVRVRGSAKTIYDKYMSLAHDASVSGRRVKAESYLQHAEHYLRIVQEQAAAAEKQKLLNEKRDAEQAARRAEHEARVAKNKKSGNGTENPKKGAQETSREDATANDTDKAEGRARSYLNRRKTKPQDKPQDTVELSDDKKAEKPEKPKASGDSTAGLKDENKEPVKALKKKRAPKKAQTEVTAAE